MKNRISAAKKALIGIVIAAFLFTIIGFGIRSSIRMKSKGEDHLPYARNIVTMNDTVNRIA